MYLPTPWHIPDTKTPQNDDDDDQDGLEEEAGPCVRHRGKPKLWTDPKHPGNSLFPSKERPSMICLQRVLFYVHMFLASCHVIRFGNQVFACF